MIRFSCYLLLALFIFGTTALANPIKQVKIGAILPLTGPLAEYGTAVKNGLEMAQAEHAELFKQIQFIYEDSQYDSKLALAGYQKLRAADDVSLIYIWGYGPSQAVAPVAETQKIPVIATSGALPIFATSKHIIRFAFCMDRAAAILTGHLRKFGVKRFAVVKTEMTFTNEMYNEMLKNLQEGEIIDLAADFTMNEMDFRSVLGKLRNKKFDGLGVFLASGQISQFYRQMQQYGLKTRTFGTDFFDSVAENRASGGAMTGAEFVAQYVVPDFAKRYVKLTGNDLQVSSAAVGYETASLIGRSLAGADKAPTADEVVQALRKNGSQSAGATEYNWIDAGECTGFEVKNVMKRMEKDRVVDISK